MRFVAHSATSPRTPRPPSNAAARSLRVTHAYAPRGTLVAIVGTRASCQPIPVLITSIPASSSARASATTSSQLEPPSTRSSIERRKMSAKSGPHLARVALTMSSASRLRFS